MCTIHYGLWRSACWLVLLRIFLGRAHQLLVISVLKHSWMVQILLVPNFSYAPK